MLTRVFRVAQPAPRGQRSLPAARRHARVGSVTVGPQGTVVATDRTGWVGLQWRTLADRLVRTGAKIEEVTGAEDAQDGRPQETAEQAAG